LTLILDGAMLAAGVQAATRPRTGLSPPDRFHATKGSNREPPFARIADCGL